MNRKEENDKLLCTRTYLLHGRKLELRTTNMKSVVSLSLLERVFFKLLATESILKGHVHEICSGGVIEATFNLSPMQLADAQSSTFLPSLHQKFPTLDALQ